MNDYSNFERIDLEPESLAAVPREDEDGPLKVRGVALPEDHITHGGSKERVYWPPETVEAAAESLTGTKIVDDSAHDIPEDDIPTQPPVRSIVGEVTDSRYHPGVGVVYEGKIDDPQISRLVEEGHVEVSPFMFRRLGDLDEEKEALRAEEILKWRDLATVEAGASEGASIEPAAGATALSAEGLSEALAEEFDEGTSPDGEDPEASSDEHSENTESADADGDSHMDFTDEEKNLVRKARRTDDPTVVSGADAEALSELESFDDPHVVEADDYQATAESLADYRSALIDTAVEDGAMKPSEAVDADVEALHDALSEDGEEFTAEALMQVPETGTTEEAEEGTDDDGVEALSEEEAEEVRSLSARAETFDSFNPEHAEALRSEAAELAGVEEFEKIDTEEL